VSSIVKYQLALTLLKGVGTASLRPLLEHFDPEEIFNSSPQELKSKVPVRPGCIQTIAAFNDWERVEQEIRFIESNNINTYFLTEKKYPFRLRECADAPLLLYARGKITLHSSKMLAIVGTRSHSAVGKKFTENILAAIQAFPDAVIVSGLAAGIDTIAHEEALRNKLPTLAVLAHGLDRIYPPVNKRLATEIVNSGGGLLSECKRGEEPDRFLFPRRNRIVAGMTDATLVIESDLKGGSLITANLAFNYGRTVFAMPGRVYDSKSSGCLSLIKTQKAQLITSAEDLFYWLNWTKDKLPPAKSFENKVSTLTEDEKIILSHLHAGDEKHVDLLLQSTGWTPAKLAAILLSLSLADHIVSLPGNKYQLI